MVARRKKTSKKAGIKPGKDRILERLPAEQLFARHGFYGVSVRDITKAADVDVALVSYHFGGKRELLRRPVFQRHAGQLDPERLAMLENVRRAALPGIPTLEQIVNAFTHPLLERSARGGAGWKSYFALVAQVNESARRGTGADDSAFRSTGGEIHRGSARGSARLFGARDLLGLSIPHRRTHAPPLPGRAASTDYRAGFASPRIWTACTNVSPRSFAPNSSAVAAPGAAARLERQA